MSVRSAAVPLLCLALSSCAGAPSPKVDLPNLALRMQPYLGSPLRGPAHGQPQGAPLATVRAEWLWLEKAPASLPLAAQARALVTFAHVAPFAVAVPASAVGVLAPEVLAELPTRLAAGDHGQTLPTAPQVCALWADSAVVFASGGAPAQVHVFASEAGSVRVAVVEPTQRGSVSVTSASSAAVLDADLASDVPVALCMAVPRPGAPDAALICQLRAQRGASASLEAACREQFAAPLAAVEPAPSVQMATAAQTLAGESRRATLVHLAALGGCPLLEEFALLADDAVLATLADAAHLRIADAAAAAPVAFAAQAAALRWLAQARDSDQLPADLASAAARQLGEVAAASSALTRAAAAPAPAELTALLRAENLAALEDPQPVVRVRAFDWLTRRQWAPKGYDPLGPRQARRAALAAEEAR